MEGEENGVPPSEPELRLRRCLDARTRRWAAAEFFYSALDRPWFMRNEMRVCSPFQLLPSSCLLCWKPSLLE